MTIKDAFSHNYIILDACCVINLYASGQMRAILKVIPKNLSIATYVKENEVLKIYSGPLDNVTASYEIIDLQPFIKDKLLILVDIENELEENSYVNFSQKLDDGEAITGAIAINRNWAIATDENKAIKLFQNKAPHIVLVSTLELIKFWVDTTKPDEKVVQEAILNIKIRGRYEPHRNHSLFTWWGKFR